MNIEEHVHAQSFMHAQEKPDLEAVCKQEVETMAELSTIWLSVEGVSQRAC